MWNRNPRQLKARLWSLFWATPSTKKTERDRREGLGTTWLESGVLAGPHRGGWKWKFIWGPDLCTVDGRVRGTLDSRNCRRQWTTEFGWGFWAFEIWAYVGLHSTWLSPLNLNRSKYFGTTKLTEWQAGKKNARNIHTDIVCFDRLNCKTVFIVK